MYDYIYCYVSFSVHYITVIIFLHVMGFMLLKSKTSSGCWIFLLFGTWHDKEKCESWI